MDKKEEAEILSIEAQANSTYINDGVLSPGEVRDLIINDEETPYNGLNVEMSDAEFSEFDYSDTDELPELEQR